VFEAFHLVDAGGQGRAELAEQYHIGTQFVEGGAYLLRGRRSGIYKEQAN